MTRALLCLLLLVAPIAAACSSLDPIAEEDMAESTTLDESVAVAAFKTPDHEVLTYSGTWTGIPAGEAVIETIREDGVYRSTGEIATIGVVSVLYGVEFRAESEADDASKLSTSWLYETDLDDEKRVVVRFAPSTGKLISVIRKPENIEKVIVELPGARDPLAMVAAVRSTDLTPGRSFTAHVFSEKNVYRANVLVVGPESAEVPAGTFDTQLVRVDLIKVVEGVPEEESRAIAVWVTADERRIPVRIDADTKIGRIKLSLTSYEDAPK